MELFGVYVTKSILATIALLCGVTLYICWRILDKTGLFESETKHAQSGNSEDENIEDIPEEEQEETKEEYVSHVSDDYPISNSYEKINLYQEELNRYWEKQRNSKNKKGKLYERWIGYKLCMEGYDVTYFAGKGGKDGDFGIDLICKNHAGTWVVQCKNQQNKISPSVVRDFAGTISMYTKNFPEENVKGGMFFTSSQFSNNAKDTAKEFDIKIFENEIMPESFPIIKCIFSKNLYYLPTDEGYQDISVNFYSGDCYCKTVLEAENKGFRRYSLQSQEDRENMSSEYIDDYVTGENLEPSNTDTVSTKKGTKPLSDLEQQAVRNIQSVIDEHRKDEV